MGTYGLTFAAVGLAYTGIDCVAETFRGTLQLPDNKQTLLIYMSSAVCSVCHACNTQSSTARYYAVAESI